MMIFDKHRKDLTDFPDGNVSKVFLIKILDCFMPSSLIFQTEIVTIKRNENRKVGDL